MQLPPLSPEQRVKPLRFELRLSLIFATTFIAVGVHLPYFPLWLAAEGFDAQQIAVILAAPMFVRVLTTPLVTALADRSRDRANVLVVMTVGSLAASLGYFLAPTYLLVLAISLIFAVFLTPLSPLSDSLALSGVRRFGSNYPAMRIWGSISFLTANLGGGLILALTGVGAVPVLISSGLVAAVATSLLAPRLGRPRIASPLSAAGLQAAGSRPFSRRFMLLVVGAGLVAASHGFLYGFVSIYWESIGLGAGVVGFLWSWAVIAEVGMFLTFNRLFAGRSASSVLVIAGVAAMLRWLVMPFIWPAGLGVGGFVATQTLHALSTALVLIGVQKLIVESVPEERIGAAQGIAFFANGFAMATVTLLSGPLYAAFGIDGMLLMIPVAAVGVAVILASRRTVG